MNVYWTSWSCVARLPQMRDVGAHIDLALGCEPPRAAILHGACAEGSSFCSCLATHQLAYIHYRRASSNFASIAGSFGRTVVPGGQTWAVFAAVSSLALASLGMRVFLQEQEHVNCMVGAVAGLCYVPRVTHMSTSCFTIHHHLAGLGIGTIQHRNRFVSKPSR